MENSILYPVDRYGVRTSHEIQALSEEDNTLFQILACYRSRILETGESPSSKKAVSPEVKERLLEYFRDDIRKTENLLGRSLEHWMSV